MESITITRDFSSDCISSNVSEEFTERNVGNTAATIIDCCVSLTIRKGTCSLER